MADLESVVQFIRKMDDAEGFALDGVELTELQTFLLNAAGCGILRKEQLETRSLQGLLVAQVARAVSRQANGDHERAALLLDEVSRSALEHDGAKGLVILADALDESGVGPGGALPRLYGLHALDQEEALLETLNGVSDDLIPPTILSDAVMLLDDAGQAKRAVGLVDRTISYHVRRRTPEPAFFSWMIAENSGLVPLDTLLRYLRLLYPLDSKQVVKLVGQLSAGAAEEGNRRGVIRCLRTIVKESGKVPSYFVPHIRKAFPDAEEALGSTIELIDDYVEPEKVDATERVEIILKFLPGRYAYIRRQMVARIKDTDGRKIRLVGPGGERFDETFSQSEFELLEDEDYRVRVRFSPGVVRKEMNEDPAGFILHVLNANGGKILDEELRHDLGAEVTNSSWEKWFEAIRALLKKDKKIAAKYSLTTMSFSVREPAVKKAKTA